MSEVTQQVNGALQTAVAGARAEKEAAAEARAREDALSQRLATIEAPQLREGRGGLQPAPYQAASPHPAGAVGCSRGGGRHCKAPAAAAAAAAAAASRVDAGAEDCGDGAAVSERRGGERVADDKDASVRGGGAGVGRTEG